MVLLEIVQDFTCIIKTGDTWGSKYEYRNKEKTVCHQSTNTVDTDRFL